MFSLPENLSFFRTFSDSSAEKSRSQQCSPSLPSSQCMQKPHHELRQTVLLICEAHKRIKASSCWEEEDQAMISPLFLLLEENILYSSKSHIQSFSFFLPLCQWITINFLQTPQTPGRSLGQMTCANTALSSSLYLFSLPLQHFIYLLPVVYILNCYLSTAEAQCFALTAYKALTWALTALNSHHHQEWGRYFCTGSGFWVLCLPRHPYPITLTLQGTKQSLGAKMQAEHVLGCWPPEVQTALVISSDGPCKCTHSVAVLQQP